MIFCEEVLCMDMNKIRPASDAAWYCRKDAEEERFYEIFFQLCRKYSVRWASATPKEKSFIEEVTRVTYERDRAQRLGLLLTVLTSTLFSSPLGFFTDCLLTEMVLFRVSRSLQRSAVISPFRKPVTSSR